MVNFTITSTLLLILVYRIILATCVDYITPEYALMVDTSCHNNMIISITKLCVDAKKCLSRNRFR